VSVYNIFLMAFAAAAVIPSALAQQAARPAPSDPAAAVPAVGYESAFSGYVPYKEQDIASWRGINDEAARTGGHIGVLRQSGMQGSKPSAGFANPSPTMPAMPGHGPGR